MLTGNGKVRTRDGYSAVELSAPINALLESGTVSSNLVLVAPALL
jgi:hypothetical protein